MEHIIIIFLVAICVLLSFMNNNLQKRVEILNLKIKNLEIEKLFFQNHSKECNKKLGEIAKSLFNKITKS